MSAVVRVWAGVPSSVPTNNVVLPPMGDVLVSPLPQLLPVLRLDGTPWGLSQPVDVIHGQYTDSNQRGLAFHRTADGRWDLDDEARVRLFAWRDELTSHRLAHAVWPPLPPARCTHLALHSFDVPGPHAFAHWAGVCATYQPLSTSSPPADIAYGWRVAVGEHVAAALGGKRVPLLVLPTPIWVQGDQTPLGDDWRFCLQLDASRLSDHVSDHETFVFVSQDQQRTTQVFQFS
jgi:hypothetical protein